MTVAADLSRICAGLGTTPEKILARNRTCGVAALRKQVAVRLRAEGYSWRAIGRVMKRDHNTIRYLCDPEYGARKRKMMRAIQQRGG